MDCTINQIVEVTYTPSSPLKLLKKSPHHLRVKCFYIYWFSWDVTVLKVMNCGHWPWMFCSMGEENLHLLSATMYHVLASIFFITNTNISIHIEITLTESETYKKEVKLHHFSYISCFFFLSFFGHWKEGEWY